MVESELGPADIDSFARDLGRGDEGIVRQFGVGVAELFCGHLVRLEQAVDDVLVIAQRDDADRFEITLHTNGEVVRDCRLQPRIGSADDLVDVVTGHDARQDVGLRSQDGAAVTGVQDGLFVQIELGRCAGEEVVVLALAGHHRLVEILELQPFDRGGLARGIDGEAGGFHGGCRMWVELSGLRLGALPAQTGAKAKALGRAGRSHDIGRLARFRIAAVVGDARSQPIGRSQSVGPLFRIVAEHVVKQTKIRRVKLAVAIEGAQAATEAVDGDLLTPLNGLQELGV